MMQADVKSAVAKAVRTAKPHGREICGLLIDNGHFIELHQTKNQAKAGGSFCFNAKEIRSLVRAATIMNHSVVGTFHSHPSGISSPGPGDISNAVDRSLMLIIDCMAQRADLWSIKNGKVKKAKLKLIEA